MYIVYTYVIQNYKIFEYLINETLQQEDDIMYLKLN